jgi:RHS repeat-associated protein
MNNFNVLRSNSKGFGANLTDFHSGQLKTLDRLVDSKNYNNTIINPDDIVLDTIAPYDNTIFSKQNLGPYKYTYHNDTLSYAANLPKPKSAVKQIESSTADLSKFRQKLTYTSFNSVKTIKDSIVRSIGVGNPPDTIEITKTFYYGSDGQRVLMVSKEDNVITAKKYYVGEVEYTFYPSSAPAKEVTFISSPTGLCAADVKLGTTGTFYYIITDHLGSITQLLTHQGITVDNARFSYDAWGRLRDVRSTNPYLIGYVQTTAFTILDRGYCGHEHLLEHGIINMNGRIYDPIVGQFMQADNYIQTPEAYIGYNRYAYCRYNPFKYTDPSGEMFSDGDQNKGTDPAARWMYADNMDRMAEAYAPVISPNACENYYEGKKKINGVWVFYHFTASEAATAASEATSDTETNGVSGEPQGKTSSNVLPTPMDPDKIKAGQIIIGKDGKQYKKGKDGLFSEVGGTNNEMGGNITSAETSLAMNASSWAWGTAMSVLRLIPEEPFARAMLKSSTYLSIGVAIYDIGLIGIDAKENGFNHSTFWGITTTAGLSALSNVVPIVGIPLSAAYWIGDEICKQNNNGASLVQMYTFYNYGECPTPWLPK